MVKIELFRKYERGRLLPLVLRVLITVYICVCVTGVRRVLFRAAIPSLVHLPEEEPIQEAYGVPVFM